VRTNAGLPPFFGDGASPTVTAFIPWDDTHFAVMDINRQSKEIQIYPHGEGNGFGPEKKLWIDALTLRRGRG
jgi:hypothetical protein